MRIGDLDLAEKSIEENLNIAPCDRFAAMDEVRDTPTIDHETLPIVRELRAKLKRVTTELDAAIADLKILSDCDYCKYDCKNYEEDDCRFCSVKKCKCRTCKDGSSWEWRGLVAENVTTESEVQADG